MSLSLTNTEEEDCKPTVRASWQSMFTSCKARWAGWFFNDDVRSGVITPLLLLGPSPQLKKAAHIHNMTVSVSARGQADHVSKQEVRHHPCMRRKELNCPSGCFFIKKKKYFIKVSLLAAAVDPNPFFVFDIFSRWTDVSLWLPHCLGSHTWHCCTNDCFCWSFLFDPACRNICKAN